MKAWRRERVPLDPALREELDRDVMGLRWLQEIVQWGFSRSPPRDIAAVVVQDEYSHDVVLPWRGGLYLAFDTT